MAETFIPLQEAATLSGKSVQTLRRAIKTRKIRAKRLRTPQGYNYQVSQGSVIDFYKLKQKLFDRKQQGLNDDLDSQVTSRMNSRKVRNASKKLFLFNEKKYLTPEDLEQFNKSFREFARQSQKEREEMLCLIKAFQERVIVLENQVKLLDSADQRRW